MDQKKAKTPVVMIIEDDQLLLKAIVTKLEKSSLSTIPTASCEEALDYLHNHKAGKPDVIWLDYYLKGMNGLDFMNELKKEPEFADIPVIVVSNSANPQKVDTMLNLGVKEYLLKAEHRLEDIIDVIYKVL